MILDWLSVPNCSPASLRHSNIVCPFQQSLTGLWSENIEEGITDKDVHCWRTDSEAI